MDNSKQMTLFGTGLDVKETIKNVKHFFEIDYPAAKRRSHQDVSGVSSLAITDMPKGTPSGNAMEERLVNRVYCRQVVAATSLAIGWCSKWSQKILKWLYLDGRDDTYCIMNLPYSEKWYYKKLKPAALVEFAEAYSVEELLVFKKVQ